MPFGRPRVALVRLFARRHRPTDPGYGVGEGGAPDQGMPIDPDYGVDEGGAPDQGLPGGGGRPGRLPAFGLDRLGRPIDPDYGLPIGGGRPSHPIERPPWLMFPPGPTDPDYGIDAPAGTPEHPIFIEDVSPEHPLPPVEGGEPPETDPPPGTIWPPLPPEAPPGKHAFLFFISGVGLRYGVLTVPPHKQPK